MRGDLHPVMLMPKPIAVCVAYVLRLRMPQPIILGYRRGNP